QDTLLTPHPMTTFNLLFSIPPPPRQPTPTLFPYTTLFRSKGTTLWRRTRLRVCVPLTGLIRRQCVAFTNISTLRGTRKRCLWHLDRKSTRLNSSHGSISYAVFCLKKKIRSRTPHKTPLAKR